MKCRIRTETDVFTAVVDAILRLVEMNTISRVKPGVFEYNGFVPNIEYRLCIANGCGTVSSQMCNTCNKPICGQSCLQRHVDCEQCIKK